LEVLLAFLEDSGYLKYLVKNNEIDKIDLLNQFYRKIKAFDESAIDPTLKNFMEELNLELESGEEGKLEFDPEKGPDMIKVMTIHGAKGLEFKYVFIVNMVDRRFPTDQRKDPIELPDALIKDIRPTGDVHLQEERRLCYVAMTRAKKELYFTSADDYGGQRKKKISRFLAEMEFSGGQDVSASGGVRAWRAPLGEASRENEASRHISRGQTPPQYLPEHFSYSQLAAFEKCPLQYKFGFILKIPTRGKAVFSFGKTMHNTFEAFLKLVNSEKKVQQSVIPGLTRNPESAHKPLDSRFRGNDSFKDLEKIYEENWIDEWYDSKKEKDEYYKNGKRIIKEFYDQFLKTPPKILKVNGTPALEIPFNLKINGYTLYGVIDRIDEVDGGVAILDYKTGQPKDKLDLDAKEQLLIYQIAAQEVLHLKPKQLAYYYLENGKLASFLGSESELIAQKEKIISEIEKIKNSEFEPTPGWQCQYCDFKDICDFAQR
jgi:DNA helicase-2/ATP-dependent DNA helicase PcrA